MYKKLILALVGALGIGFGPAQSQPAGGIYYNISDDPNSLQLLDLNNMGVERGITRLNVIDLFRGTKEFGVATVWEIDCAGERMGVISAMQFEPGTAGADAPINSEEIDPRSTSHSWMMFSLACNGEGDLLERRVFRGSLGEIVKRFWAP